MNTTSPGRLQRLRALGVLLRRVWFGVGPVAAGRAALRRLRRPEPAVDAWKTAPPTGPHPFDTRFGVDTGGFIGWRDLQSGGANDPFISGYLGVPPSIGRRMIDVVEQPDQYVFVDYGCGKGRAAILASERPFRRVIGLEIVASLADCARRNAAVVRRAYPDRPAIEVVHGDATLFELPPEPLALFFYQPFERPVMRAVLTRLERSLAAAPRPVVVLYLNPLTGRLLDSSPVLRRMGRWSGQPAEDERPFSFGGRGGSEEFVVWGTRCPEPAIRTPQI